MKKLLPLLFLVSMLSTAYAQLSQGGKPISLKKGNLLTSEVVFERMPAVDVETLLAEDEINYPDKSRPYRFGEKHFVSMSLENSGEWEILPNGDRVWRLGVVSADAYTLNFIFENFYLPEAGKLHIFNSETGHVLGAFTNRNNIESGWFGTFLLKGDQAVLEYYEPKSVQGEGHFELAEVVHGYRDILNWSESNERGGGSGSCNIDVECPLGNGWDDQINSVGILISNGSGFCTGAMVADVPQSGTPYFLTANHCVGGSVANWSVGFNYQVTSCNGGTQSQQFATLSGATLRASNGGSDMALLEWNNSPTQAMGVFYAGWSNLNVASTQSTAIHHPSGDFKKISRDNGTVTNSTYSGAETWRVGAWEEGTTEPGSSGSPLFDQNKRIVGQLYGGSASCSLPNDPDFYGKFSTSWDGPSNSTRLRNWLDPQNTGTSTVDGFDPFTPAVSYDAQLISIDNPTQGSSLCESSVEPTVTIMNNGSVTLTSIVVNYTINGTPGSTTWTGSLPTGSSAAFTLPNIGLNSGSNTLVVTLSNPNNQSDGDNGNNSSSVTFNSVSGDTFVTLIINTDDYGSETTWTLTQNGGGTVATGGPYEDDTNEQFEEEICVESGECYTFTIFDSFSDGICCYTGTQNPNYEDGNYSIGDADGELIYTGSEFGASEATNFCVPASASACSVLFDLFDSNASAFRLYPNNNGGFITGSNSFGDLVKAQEFAAPSQPSEITGFVAWIAAKTDAGGAVIANAYAMDGLGTNLNGVTNNAPGTVLATSSTPLARVDTSSFFTRFVFNAPVTVTADYAVGLDFSSFGNNDEIGIVSNTDGDASGNELAWESWDNGDWYTMNSAWNSASDGDFDLALFPVLCPLNVTGITDMEGQFNVFPNPSNGEFVIVNGNGHVGNLQVFDAIGQVVSERSLAGETAVNISIANQKSGIYLVRITTESGIWNSRIVVSK
ncbi:T9SS type A sorting domain-containing protein [Flavobacteriales bacterium]|nr:T9SS type A sorting domain-containing protein [Flavobacteriales bacterium]